MTRPNRIPKTAFMASHKSDIDDVSERLRADWADYRQLPEVRARIETFRADRERYFALQQRSLVLLSEQWENGVQGVHDDCSIVPDEEVLRWQFNDKLLSKSGAWHVVHEDEMTEEETVQRESSGLNGKRRFRTYKLPFKRHQDRLISDRYRCGSITCRPGDPFGCALGKRRMHMDRIALILKAWSEHGGAVEATQFGLYGAPDEPLASVLEVEQEAFNHMVGGGAWVAFKRIFDVQGYLCVLNVKRDNEKRRWAVERWVMLARQAVPINWEGLALRLTHRHGRRVRRHSAYTCGIAPSILVGSYDVAGFAQFVAGAVSTLDAAPSFSPCAHCIENGERGINELWQSRGDEWEELVRALHGLKMLTASRSSTDHPVWKAASKRARETFVHPDWRRPTRPQLSFDGLPPTPTPYEVLSPGAARQRKIKPGDRVHVLQVGRSWNPGDADEWKARHAAQQEQYLRSIGIVKGGKA
ncbi:hypothetical protein ACFY9N_05850 [Microbacterium sp. NPDC008134]|uniref:hypothetical protein n=1 Tax=Microbacterium sp. NPDC008134 TaxID=3364183 RepID=UPI0036F15875